MMEQKLLPALHDPVHATQRIFRRALSALSEPGVAQDISDVPGLDRLMPATYALCLCLLDSDTPVWISPRLVTPALRANLAFHCACPIVDEPGQAIFAILDGDGDSEITGFDSGSDRDPHLSCTLLIQLDALDGGHPAAWEGPGIQGKRVVRLPFPEALWAQRAAHVFPRGLDCFVAAGNQFLGLPRSTRVLPMMQEVT